MERTEEEIIPLKITDEVFLKKKRLSQTVTIYPTMEFITVATFSLPNEAHIVKGRLESEDITCFLKDVNTIEANNFYSNALGGIKLQVLESDVEKSVALLLELGYLNPADFEPSKFWAKVNRKTNTIPLINSLPIELRFFLLIALALFVFISAILILF